MQQAGVRISSSWIYPYKNRIEMDHDTFNIKKWHHNYKFT